MKVLFDATLLVVQDKLAAYLSLEQRTCIPTDNLMEMLTCVETTYFRMEPDIYQQEEGQAMGSTLSPVLANVYMEYSEEMALGITKAIIVAFIRRWHVNAFVSPGRYSSTTGSGELNQTIYTVQYGERTK